MNSTPPKILRKLVVSEDLDMSAEISKVVIYIQNHIYMSINLFVSI